MPDFRDLPFFERPDLTPYIVHLTKNTRNQDDGRSAFRNLVNILRTGEIWGSTTERGFIRGPNPATCFMDVPFASLKYVLNPRDADPGRRMIVDRIFDAAELRLGVRAATIVRIDRGPAPPRRARRSGGRR